MQSSNSNKLFIYVDYDYFDDFTDTINSSSLSTAPERYWNRRYIFNERKSGTKLITSESFNF
jgi:hypothetical protein